MTTWVFNDFKYNNENISFGEHEHENQWFVGKKEVSSLKDLFTMIKLFSDLSYDCKKLWLKHKNLVEFQKQNYQTWKALSNCLNKVNVKSFKELFQEKAFNKNCFWKTNFWNNLNKNVSLIRSFCSLSPLFLMLSFNHVHLKHAAAYLKYSHLIIEVSARIPLSDVSSGMCSSSSLLCKHGIFHFLKID